MNNKPEATPGPVNNIAAIKAFFGDVRPVSLEEIRALDKDERAELGAECRKALGA